MRYLCAPLFFFVLFAASQATADCSIFSKDQSRIARLAGISERFNIESHITKLQFDALIKYCVDQSDGRLSNRLRAYYKLMGLDVRHKSAALNRMRRNHLPQASYSPLKFYRSANVEGLSQSQTFARFVFELLEPFQTQIWKVDEYRLAGKIRDITSSFPEGSKIDIYLQEISPNEYLDAWPRTPTPAAALWIKFPNGQNAAMLIEVD